MTPKAYIELTFRQPLPANSSHLVMRFLRLVTCTLSPLAFIACLSGTETTSTNNGTPIDCATLATDLVGQESTLTTTASGLKFRDPLVGTGATASSGATVR